MRCWKEAAGFLLVGNSFTQPLGTQDCPGRFGVGGTEAICQWSSHDGLGQNHPGDPSQRVGGWAGKEGQLDGQLRIRGDSAHDGSAVQWLSGGPGVSSGRGAGPWIQALRVHQEQGRPDQGLGAGRRPEGEAEAGQGQGPDHHGETSLTACGSPCL